MINSLVCQHLQDFNSYHVADNNYPYVLNANESPYNIFDYIKDDLLLGILNYQPNLYPDPMAIGLRDKLSKYTNVNSPQIICGNGSDEIISMIISTFIEDNDVVVTHAPTFDMYHIGTKMAKGNLITVQDNIEYQIDVDTIIDTANNHNAKMIFLCVPNNPTGYAVSKEDIIKILDNTNCIVVLDEAYYEFYGISSIDLIEKYNKIIILRTLSKAFGLAGLRVGYAISSEEIIEWIYKIKQPYNLNSISQLISEIVLDRLDIIQPLIKNIINERDLLYNSLIGIKDIKVFPSSANFLLLRTMDSCKLNNYLVKRGILVKYYGDRPLLNNCFRISVGTKETNKLLLDTIKEAVK